MMQIYSNTLFYDNSNYIFNIISQICGYGIDA